jgi:gamma-glutamylcyclotransferase (GGCT)/AIG2-like uncharacterized protein YtfP
MVQDDPTQEDGWDVLDQGIEMTKSLVFIYGTLKQGQCRAGSMLPSRYLGIASITGYFTMYNAGSYPALVSDEIPADRRVRGELYECDEDMLRDLDQIEGVPHLFNRAYVKLDEINLSHLPTTEDTYWMLEEKRAISYVYVDQERLIEEAELIESGFWTDDLKKA